MTNKEIANKVLDIQRMHLAVINLGNEYAEEKWFMTYPDGAGYDDLWEMAQDPEMLEWLYEDYEFIMRNFA